MLELTLENFEEEILNSLKPCLVTFKHDHCHLCRGLSSVLGHLGYKYGEQFKFAYIDSFAQEHLRSMFDVEGVPTVFLFMGGDAIEVEYPEKPSPMSGYSEKYLTNFLDRVLDGEYDEHYEYDE